MAWQPAEEPLRQLAGFLNDSLNPANPAAQKHAEQVRKSGKWPFPSRHFTVVLAETWSNMLFAFV